MGAQWIDVRTEAQRPRAQDGPVSEQEHTWLQGEHVRLRADWGIATCDTCGDVIVLGEEARRPLGRRGDTFCLNCQTQPAPAPESWPEFRLDIGDVVARKRDDRAREELSDAA